MRITTNGTYLVCQISTELKSQSHTDCSMEFESIIRFMALHAETCATTKIIVAGYHAMLAAFLLFQVCLVTKRNDTGPLRQCVDASTTNWQLPVSIGSSIGAILALSIIVLIVLLSRCQIPFRYCRR